jgi:biopolymer transport protein ExbD
MGVSLPGAGGGGRGRSVAADLNLVPFIDLLSVCITFLMVTAVWTQISTMQVDQNISNEPPPPIEDDTPPPPPLTIHIRSDGIWMGRFVVDTEWPPGSTVMMTAGKNYAMIGEEHDWFAIETDMTTDRETFADETMAVIVTDDGVFYENMVKALDLARAKGYEQNMLGGGPASATPIGLAPPTE